MTRPALPPLSLAHVSLLHLSPPELVRIAAESDFEHVGLRLLPARPEETKLPIAVGSDLYRDTRRALSEHGVSLLDFELIWLHAGSQATDHLDTLEAAASLGAKHLLVTSREAPSAYLTEAFVHLCEQAARFSLSVNLEFLPWTAMNTLDSALQTVTEADCSNGKVMLDSLHLYRSRSSFDAMRQVPRERLAYAQICDAPRVRPPSAQALAEEAKFRRLLPGEGELPLDEFIGCLPTGMALSVEVPHTAALQSSSALEYARRARMSTLGVLQGGAHGNV